MSEGSKKEFSWGEGLIFFIYDFFLYIFFFNFNFFNFLLSNIFLEGGKTTKRPGTDHVTSGPMRGLKKTSPDGTEPHSGANSVKIIYVKSSRKEKKMEFIKYECLGLLVKSSFKRIRNIHYWEY